jgi:hypothetical protein
MRNDALLDHVVNNGRVLLGCGYIDAEAQAHDASGADRCSGEAKLLVGDIMAANCHRVVEVVASNVSLVEVGDVEAASTDELVCFAL